MAAGNYRRAVTCLVIVLAFSHRLRAQAPETPASPAERTFDIVASRYKFTPNQIEVTEGDRVLLNVHSADGTHGFSIKDFQIKQKVPKTGEMVAVSFVADKAGTFKFMCSEYCGGGHSSMKGTLIVHPRAK